MSFPDNIPSWDFNATTNFLLRKLLVYDQRTRGFQNVCCLAETFLEGGPALALVGLCWECQQGTPLSVSHGQSQVKQVESGTIQFHFSLSSDGPTEHANGPRAGRRSFRKMPASPSGEFRRATPTHSLPLPSLALQGKRQRFLC